MISAFRSGHDIHRATASEMFKVPLHDVTDDLRRKAKTINFGIVYGQQAQGLSAELRCSEQEAQKALDRYWSALPKVRSWIEMEKAKARQAGGGYTLGGRFRATPGIASDNKWDRASAERQLISAIVQGSAQEFIKKAMVRVDGSGYDLRLQIHDELLVVHPERGVQEAMDDIQYLMETVCQLDVPLEVNIDCAHSWAEAK